MFNNAGNGSMDRAMGHTHTLVFTRDLIAWLGIVQIMLTYDKLICDCQMLMILIFECNIVNIRVLILITSNKTIIPRNSFILNIAN